MKTKSDPQSDVAPSTPQESDTEPPMLVSASSKALAKAPTCVAATQVSFRLMTSSQLRAYVCFRTVRCNAHVEGFRRRASELYPALLEVETRYNKKQGARTDLHDLEEPGFHEFLTSVGVPPGTYRSWKSRINSAMRRLGEVGEVDEARAGYEKKGARRSSRQKRSSADASKIAALAGAEKNLPEATAGLGPLAEAGNAQAKRYLAEYEQAHCEALARADAIKTDTEGPEPDLKLSERLTTVVQSAERYISVLEVIVHSESVALTDTQKYDLERASEQWRKVHRERFTLSWPDASPKPIQTSQLSLPPTIQQRVKVVSV